MSAGAKVRPAVAMAFAVRRGIHKQAIDAIERDRAELVERCRRIACSFADVCDGNKRGGYCDTCAAIRALAAQVKAPAQAPAQAKGGGRG